MFTTAPPFWNGVGGGGCSVVLTEDFSAGAAPWTNVPPDGGAADFVMDSFGLAFHAKPITSFGAYTNLDRTYSPVDVVVNRVELRCKVGSPSGTRDDGVEIRLLDTAGSLRCGILVARETYYDAANRMSVWVNGVQRFLGGSRLPTNEWVLVRIDLKAGAGAALWRIEKISDGSLWDSGSFGGGEDTGAAFSFAKIRLRAEASAGNTVQESWLDNLSLQYCT